MKFSVTRSKTMRDHRKIEQSSQQALPVPRGCRLQDEIALKEYPRMKLVREQKEKIENVLIDTFVVDYAALETIGSDQ
ncbi:hypothetical protein J6590_008412 [Homalodisca vitripennis]|nr:hypothetical protein J6590_008412 [Homalodisca vitripennis]